MSGTYSRVGVDDPIPEGCQKIVEGYAGVLFLPAKSKKQRDEGEGEANSEAKEAAASAAAVAAEDGQCVFYNPAQVVNRDLSVCAIETFSRLRKDEKPRHGGTKDGITILEALSATGLRAIRYWKEISGVKRIIANDIDADAVKLIDMNCEYNGIGPECIVRNHDDAVVLMQRLALDPFALNGQRLVLMPAPGAPADAAPKELLQQEKMDVVDLDPYGTATPFLDSAISCAKEGALMLVTCTDSNILCGAYPEKCFANYNGICIKTDACHEMAVRLVLASIERAANKHQRYIVPLLSLHIDFYVRVFFRVYTQPAAVKLSCLKLGHFFKCTRCPCFWTKPIGHARVPRRQQQSEQQPKSKRTRDGNPKPDVTEDPSEEHPTATFPDVPPYTANVNTVSSTLDGIEPTCEVCGGRVAIAGPIYCAPTQNRDFLDKLLAVIEEKHVGGHITTRDRIRGMVTVARDELPRAPLFYSLPEIASLCRVHCPPTSMFVGALASLGYECSQVHCDKSGLKTDAPPKIIVGVMLAYKKFAADSGEVAADATAASAAPKRDDLGGSARDTLKVAPIDGLEFSYDAKFDFRSRTTGVARFVPNAPGWGPKARHTGIKE